MQKMRFISIIKTRPLRKAHAREGFFSKSLYPIAVAFGKNDALGVSNQSNNEKPFPTPVGAG